MNINKLSIFKIETPNTAGYLYATKDLYPYKFSCIDGAMFYIISIYYYHHKDVTEYAKTICSILKTANINYYVIIDNKVSNNTIKKSDNIFIRCIKKIFMFNR